MRKMQQLWLPHSDGTLFPELPEQLRAECDAFLRWIVLGDLPPAHVGNARLWDCMLQGILHAKALRVAASLGAVIG